MSPLRAALLLAWVCAACSDVQSVPLGEVSRAGSSATSTQPDAGRTTQPPKAADPSAALAPDAAVPAQVDASMNHPVLQPIAADAGLESPRDTDAGDADDAFDEDAEDDDDYEDADDREHDARDRTDAGARDA